jgi:glutamate synthase domain-containing protein 2
MYNPENDFKLQKSVRTGDYAAFKEYSRLINGKRQPQASIRSLLRFKRAGPGSRREVESGRLHMQALQDGAFRSVQSAREAHEAIAIALNRIGGKCNRARAEKIRPGLCG